MKYSPEILCQHANNSFSVPEITDLEVKIFGVLNYRLIYTTAYDVMETFFRSFPWQTELRKGILDMILLAITLPKVGCENS